LDRFTVLPALQAEPSAVAVRADSRFTTLSALVAELRELTFAQSRRLQLAVETSRVTGFILRSDLQKVSSTTCVARWQIASIPSQAQMDIPVVGFPRWQVELLKVRNGNPGVYQIGWSADGFVPVLQDISGAREHLSTLKAG
jgi:protein ImuA